MSSASPALATGMLGAAATQNFCGQVSGAILTVSLRVNLGHTEIDQVQARISRPDVEG